MKAVTRPRRGAPAKGEVSARERILTTANELFYSEGIRAIGVDTVVERSGVSKTSLYRVFESKDALIAAFAAERDRSFWEWWDHVEAQHAGDPCALLPCCWTSSALVPYSRKHRRRSQSRRRSGRTCCSLTRPRRIERCGNWRRRLAIR